jgi:cell division protein FtsA
MTQGFIAAIDLGTSKITGVVGRKNADNVVSMLACESVPSSNCIRRGVVHNIDEVGAKVRKVVTMLENKLEKKIDKVYVSLSGQSLHTFDFWETKQLSGNTITEDTIAQLRQEAEKFTPASKHHYAVADVEYFVDDKSEQNPVGVPCSLIEAEYKIVVGRASLKSNIKKGIEEKAGMKIAGYIVGALASATVTLSDEEKMLGCAFVDFGAGTTTLSIYKGGILRRMITIPFGGKNITRDICALNYTEDQAETSKIKLGNVADDKKNSGKMSSPFSSPFSQKSSKTENAGELNNVIKMRLDEIIANLAEQIKQSGYEGQLGAGLVITGGASQLRNLDAYLTEKLKMPVRKASANKAFITHSSDFASNPAFTQAFGLLFLGKENCEHVVVEKPKPQVENVDNNDKDEVVYVKPQPRKPKPPKEKDPNKPGFGEKLTGIFGGLFKEEEDEE